MDSGDIFSYIHALERVELSSMRLKLSVVIIGIILFFASFLALEDDDASGPIPKRDIIAGRIKPDRSDDVLLDDTLTRAFVAKDLGVLVVGTFAGWNFLHDSSIAKCYIPSINSKVYIY